jgi:hypothetical protein
VPSIGFLQRIGAQFSTVGVAAASIAVVLNAGRALFIAINNTKACVEALTQNCRWVGFLTMRAYPSDRDAVVSAS